MKYLSRLTALLLAFVLLFSSSVGVIAESDISDLTRSGYDQMVSAAKEAAEAEAAAAAQEAASQPIINEGGVVYEQDIPEQTKRFDIYEVITDAQLSMGGETEITLPQSGKINLSAGTAAQWQIYIPGADMWVNIAGETGDTFALTYAVIGGMLSGGSAKVRALAGDSAAVANVSVAYGSALPPVEEEDTFVAEAAAASTFALRRSASTSNANAGIMLAVNETEEHKTYDVVVHYILENNEIVFEPYTANLAAGSNFTATVDFPVIKGYLPYLNNVQQNSLELKITNIQANVEYTVTYQPTNVDYTVIHYWQNVDNDNYTEHERETLQGLTKSTVAEGNNPEVKKNYPGFYALLYEKPVIAADGSTEVEVYYDRNYYLMSFDLDGGYGVEPIYARYGAEIGNVGKPTKAGYTFQGWSLDGTTIVELPDAMPAEKVTYKAIWKLDELAKVSVVIWGENADDEGYSYMKTSEFYAKPGETINFATGNMVCGYDTEHTHSAACYGCGNEEHTHSAACCTITAHTHSAACCTIEAHTHSDGCCSIAVHTHGPSCYPDASSTQASPSYAPDNPRNGQVYKRTFWGTTYSYIYINGTWYNYSGSVANNGYVTPNCGESEGSHADHTCVYNCGYDIEHTHGTDCVYCTEPEHTHGDGSCVYCDQPEHTHVDACMTCTEYEHQHTSSCYITDPAMEAAKWKYVRSDEVTVAADGSTVMNVYYDRVEYTFTFNVSNRTVHSFSAKWGSNIREKWTFTGTNGTSYSPENKDSWEGNVLYTARIYMVEIMPTQNITFTRASGNSTSNTFYYYVESLENAAGENKRSFESKYYDYYFELTNDFRKLYYDEDFFELKGFTRYKSARENGTEYKLSNSGTNPIDNLYFYYTRNTYNLEFYNPIELIRTAEKVPFEKLLGDYNWTPDASYAPDIYEPGSVEFEGWYLNPNCSGEKVNLNAYKMPDSKLVLYANWTPVWHTVNVYLTEEAMKAGDKLVGEQTVIHNGTATAPDSNLVKNGDYTFDNWFYKDENGVEKAFDFTMPIKKDMEIYGKWISNTLKEYTILYKIEGTNTEIADRETGSALAGKTKTFDAKGGTDLYEEYQEGYFPVVKSHSLTIDINATEENDTNTFTFWYVRKDAVPYTVYYVTAEQNDAGTLTEIELDGKTYYVVADAETASDNRKAVVTETFKPVSGYMPDAYQKRLVVNSAEGAVNQIIFYYTEDTQHAYYKITHYTQNTDGVSWSEYASSEAIGDIGKTYSASEMEIAGFTFDPSVKDTITSGELTINGLELKLYYTRNSYPYQVRYLEEYTEKVLHTPKNGDDLFGKGISEIAINIDYYDKVAPTSATMTIREETGAYDDLKFNVITFYYKEKEVKINYEVVGPAGCGTVAPESETLRVLTGKAQGSTATASSNVYRFVGWYSDAACTEANLLSTAAKYVPTKADGTAWVDGTTYYAKFDWNLADLTISKSGLNHTTGDDRESAIFVVTDSENKEIATVAIPGNGSVVIGGLTVGQTYTVTELNSWTWRYTPDSATKTVTINPPTEETEVIFTNSQTNNSWLGGDNYKINKFN